MIDEELYQQAADELNNDRRRAHIWARACALASDDHDEARYLYTNLRVEELIAERESGGAVDNIDDDNDADNEDHDTTLALEPIDLDIDQEEMEATNETDNVFQLDDISDTPETVSTPAGVDHLKNPDDYLQLDIADEEDSDALQSVRRVDFDEELPPSVDFPEEHSDLGNVPDSRIEQEFYARNKDPQTSPPVENDPSDTFDDTADFDGTAVIDFDTEEMALFQESLVEEGDPLALPNIAEESGLELELKSDHDASQHSNELLVENDLGDELGKSLGEGLNANLGEDLSAELGGNLDEGLSADLGENLGNNLDELLDNVYEAPTSSSNNAEVELTGDFSAASGTQAIVIDDELDWLEDDSEQQSTQSQLQSYSSPASPSAEELDAQRFTQELERQAEELPGQYSDVVAFSEATENHQPTATENSQASDTGTKVAQEDDDNSLVAAAASAATAAAFTATSNSPQQQQHYSPPNEPALELPIDLSDELSGTRYAVYRRASDVQAVKTGVSWSALIMTLPFLIYRHLFGTAIVYIALAIIVKVGLLISGLAWLDAGASASPLIKACTAGFALLTVLGLLYLPFRYANSWRSNKLENRGFELVAWVRAKNPGKAIMEARRAAALD